MWLPSLCDSSVRERTPACRRSWSGGLRRSWARRTARGHLLGLQVLATSRPHEVRSMSAPRTTARDPQRHVELLAGAPCPLQGLIPSNVATKTRALRGRCACVSRACVLPSASSVRPRVEWDRNAPVQREPPLELGHCSVDIAVSAREQPAAAGAGGDRRAAPETQGVVLVPGEQVVGCIELANGYEPFDVVRDHAGGARFGDPLLASDSTNGASTVLTSPGLPRDSSRRPRAALAKCSAGRPLVRSATARARPASSRACCASPAMCVRQRPQCE